MLTVVKGEARPQMTGLEVIAILRETIIEHLHSVPADDPWRSCLERIVRYGARQSGGGSA